MKTLKVGDLINCDDEMCLVLSVSETYNHDLNEVNHFGRDVTASKRIEVRNLTLMEDESLMWVKYLKGSPRSEYYNLEAEMPVDVSHV